MDNIESPWAGRYVDEAEAQLSEDEIALQWEYNTVDPTTPRIEGE
jgi:hypothetical protein